jgi:hypothetical protein
MSMDWKERIAGLILLGLMINAASAIALQWHVPVRTCPSCAKTGTTLHGGPTTCHLNPPAAFVCGVCGAGWYGDGQWLMARMTGIPSPAWWEPLPYPFFPWHHECWSWPFRR